MTRAPCIYFCQANKSRDQPDKAALVGAEPLVSADSRTLRSHPRSEPAFRSSHQYDEYITVVVDRRSFAVQYVDRQP